MRRQTLEMLLAAQRNGRVLVRAVETATGREEIIDPALDGSRLGRAALAATQSDSSRSVTLDGCNWFLTVYNSPWEIVIVGAVHIAQALAPLAKACGYRVRVIDPRAGYATKDRFGDTRLVRHWPGEALALEPLTERSALVVLAHDPKLDDEGLGAALRSPAGYIGALGSTRTHAKRLKRLAAMGFTPADLARIHGPVGLAIGARSPSEIAVAILAQLVQQRRKRRATPRIAAIVLAGGMSTRMGRNKLIMPFNGKPLVRHAVEAGLASRLGPLLVVTGHEASSVRTALQGLAVQFVQNDDYRLGLSSSLAAGIKALPPDCDGVLVLLGDMPGVTPSLIDHTVSSFDPAAGHSICVATAQGHRGHPVLWGRRFFSEITELKGDIGARALMSLHEDELYEVEVEGQAPLTDIDTPEALNAYSH